MKAYVYRRPSSLTDQAMHYCPGCGHGVAHRLIAEVVDRMGIRERTIGVAPVGCAVLAYFYFDFDVSEAAHGRGAAVATGLKRSLPDRVVFSYQGDGDLAAIGLAETVHAANRGENITVIFINNAVYGMTGGQMAPTTLVGQKTTTSPLGRDTATMGPPLRMCELLNTLDQPVFIARVALDGPEGIRSARQALAEAFRMQEENRGYSFVEALAACPTYQTGAPSTAMRFVAGDMRRAFPVRVFRRNGKVLDA